MELGSYLATGRDANDSLGNGLYVVSVAYNVWRSYICYRLGTFSCGLDCLIGGKNLTVFVDGTRTPTPCPLSTPFTDTACNMKRLVTYFARSFLTTHREYGFSMSQRGCSTNEVKEVAQ